MMEHVFSKTKKPNLFVFETNCILSRYVRGNEFFDSMGFPVDVFHFKAKHKESDTYCQQHCNPANFPDLLVVDEKTGKDKWFFNTSITEQVNAWFCRFHSICRQMHAVTYKFFRDEMIRIRNEGLKGRLTRDGKQPGYWPWATNEWITVIPIILDRTSSS